MRLLALTAATCLTVPVFAGGRTPAAAQAVTAMTEAVRAVAADNRFMGAVLVARADEILLNQGYGMANLEWQISNSPATRFRIASVTKQFTAAAVLLLEERGRLSVDDPIRKHLPDAPAAWDRITIAHLLANTSGIPNFTAFSDYPATKTMAATPATLIGRFRDRPLDFPPGERWNYSNSGYILLAYLIEKIGGVGYADFLQQHIFSPLGMRDSGYDTNAAVLPQRAAGYQQSQAGPVNAPFLHMSIPYGAGGLYSTTEDLLRWNRALFGGKVLSAQSLRKMTTPVRNNYGFGLYIGYLNGITRYSHTGGIDGFNSHLAYYRESQVTVAVLANVNGPAADDLAMQLALLVHQ